MAKIPRIQTNVNKSNSTVRGLSRGKFAGTSAVCAIFYSKCIKKLLELEIKGQGHEVHQLQWYTIRWKI